MAEEIPNKALYSAISLNDKEITDLAKKDKKMKETNAFLQEILSVSGIDKCERKTGSLLFSTAVSFQKTQISKEYLPLIVSLIKDQKVTLIPRLELAFQFIKKLSKDEKLDQAKLEDFIGVGIVVTTEDIEKAIDELFKEKEAELKELRYRVNQVNYRNTIIAKLRFPNPKDLFEIFKVKLTAYLGPQTEADKQAGKAAQKPKKEEKKGGEKKGQQVEEAPKFKIEDLVARDLGDSVNSTETQNWKKEKFGDIILTRFPPEPNGYLHLGHCRAINFNFSLAQAYKGGCYLRFDDTNPDKENHEFMDSIKRNVEWLGFKPYKVTNSSQNFDYLYECAVKLIKKGKAFVCGQSKEESKEFRESLKPSPFRNNSVEENLKLFNNMRLGLYKEGEYSLRAKIDYTSPNTTLRDPVIYRIRYTPHPNSGNKWCIYPLYDFTHPICDSIEGISYSCCTLEFEIRRELYYWVLNELEIYRPYVWEYARLNMSHNVMSKRKIQELVDKKIVIGWDDPRLLTIDGIKRRGYTPEGVLSFINILGVARTANDTIVPMHALENAIRNNLDEVAVRTLAVLDPVLVKITNLKDGEVRTFEAPDFPRQGEKSAKHTIKGYNRVFVERSDVLHIAHKDFFGMAPGTLCGLKYFGVFRCNEVIRDESGQVKEVLIEYVHDGSDKKQKPKTFVNWISEEESQDCEVRQLEYLFTEEAPGKYKGSFLDLINYDSMKSLSGAKMNKNLKLKHLDRYQFERQGFYSVDYDSNIEAGKIVWNRTVKLVDSDKSKAMDKILADIAKIEAEQKAKK